MRLDRVAVALRARSPWQAIDLGTALARHWWWPLFIAWTVPAALLFALLALLLPTPWLWSLSLLVWWLKPVWDCFPLLIVSRRLFGETLSPQQAWRQAPRLLGREALAWLSWRRLSLNRSAELPVTLLEQLRGRERRRRLNLLRAPHGSAAGWLTITGVHLEMAIGFGLIGLVAMLLPEPVDVDWFELFTSDERGWQIALAALSLAGSALVAPFYTAAGFALYINRRVELEGWDIEVRFRQLAARRALPAMRAAALLLGLALLWQPPAPLWAADDAATAAEPARQAVRERIDAVLDSPDFGRSETVTRWRLQDADDDETFEPPQWLIDLLDGIGLIDGDWTVTVAQALKYLLGLLLLAALIWCGWHYRDALRRWRPGAAPRRRATAAPAQLFGLELDTGTLPDDPLATAQVLWPQQPRAALALLYRAALMQLLARGCPLRDHHTEAECARLAAAHLPAPAAALFAELTGLWQRLAYAHRLPGDEEMAQLWRRWPQAFAGAPERADV